MAAFKTSTPMARLGFVFVFWFYRIFFYLGQKKT